MSEKQAKHIIPRSHLWRAAYYYEQVAESCYNYERMQGVGFALSISNILDDLYDPKDPANDEKRKEMMKRNSEFYNTEPEFGGLIFGAVCALEEQKALGEDIPGEFITSIKTSLMGPLAGIGDTVVQGVFRPILLAICIDITLSGTFWGAVAYLIIHALFIYGLQFGFFWFTYNKGSDAILDMLEGGLYDKFMLGAKVMGCFVMGGLIANYVGVNCGINIVTENAVFSLQETLFDAIMPGILSLAFTMFIYWLLSKKKMNSLKLVLIILVIGVVCGLTGILV